MMNISHLKILPRHDVAGYEDNTQMHRIDFDPFVHLTTGALEETEVISGKHSDTNTRTKPVNISTTGFTSSLGVTGQFLLSCPAWCIGGTVLFMMNNPF
jgi:hypothetical protein